MKTINIVLSITTPSAILIMNAYIADGNGDTVYNNTLANSQDAAYVWIISLRILQHITILLANPANEGIYSDGLDNSIHNNTISGAG